LVKYGCIYYCSFLNNKINIIRFIDYDLLKTIMERNQIGYNKYKITFINWYKNNNGHFETHRFHIDQLHYYKNDIIYSRNFIDSLYSYINTNLYISQQYYYNNCSNTVTCNDTTKICSFAFKFDKNYTNVSFNHVNYYRYYQGGEIDYRD